MIGFGPAPGIPAPVLQMHGLRLLVDVPALGEDLAAGAGVALQGRDNARSGLHFCIAADTRDVVDAFHAEALIAGGRDNGRPGVRKDYTESYYAAFVVDPDGYRIEAYCGKAI